MTINNTVFIVNVEVIYYTDVSHMPGLYLLHSGDDPCIDNKIMAWTPYFHIFDFL